MQGIERLSIVIPALNAGARLPECLARIAGAGQIVVSDGGSVDETAAVARAGGALWVSGPAGRGGQLARGAAAANGDWLLFLHADCRLPQGWQAVVAKHMSDPGLAHVFRLSFDAAAPMARVSAAWANLRTRLLGLPFGDQGLLISRELYEGVGGFADIALMEDMAMALALGRRRIRMLPATIETDATRYLAEGWVRRGARNMALQLLFLAGVDPARLARSYTRR